VTSTSVWGLETLTLERGGGGEAAREVITTGGSGFNVRVTNGVFVVIVRGLSLDR